MPVSSISQNTILLPRIARQEGVVDDSEADNPELSVESVVTDQASVAATDSPDQRSTRQFAQDLAITATVIPPVATNEPSDRQAGGISESSLRSEQSVLDGLSVVANPNASFIAPLENPSSTSQLAIDLYSRTQGLLSEQAGAALEPGQVLVGVDIFV